MSTCISANGFADLFLGDHAPGASEDPESGIIAKYNHYIDTVTRKVYQCWNAEFDAQVWVEVTSMQADWNQTDSNSWDFIKNKPSRTINNSPGRSIVTGTGATGFQISATRNAQVSYSVTIDTTSTLSGSSKGYVVIETATTNSATPGDWVEIARISSGQNNTLIVGLTLVQTGGGCMGGLTIAGGSYVKIRSVNVAGTPTYTLNSQQEVLL